MGCEIPDRSASRVMDMPRRSRSARSRRATSPHTASTRSDNTRVSYTKFHLQPQIAFVIVAAQSSRRAGAGCQAKGL